LCGLKTVVLDAEHLVCGAKVELDCVLRNPVGVLGDRCHVLGHRQLVRAVDGDRAREHEPLHIVGYRSIQDVDASDDVVRVVEAADEVREALGGVGREVIHVVVAAVGEKGIDEIDVGHRALAERRFVGNVVGKATGEVVDRDDFVAELDAVPGDMRADESSCSGNERTRQVRPPP